MDFFGQSLDFAVNLTTTIAATFVLSIKGNTVVKKFNAKEYTTAPLQISKSRLIDANGNVIKNFMAKNIMMPTVMSKALKNLETKIKTSHV